jgi:hypothetical protein
MIIPLRSNSTPIRRSAEPSPFVGNRLHLFANFRIVRRVMAPDGLGVDTDKPARPAL